MNDSTAVFQHKAAEKGRQIPICLGPWLALTSPFVRNRARQPNLELFQRHIQSRQTHATFNVVKFESIKAAIS
jgi:hypothetical protein